MLDFWLDIKNRFNGNEDALAEFCKIQAVDIEQCACLAWFLAVSDSDLRAMLSELYPKEKYTKPLLWDNPQYNNPSQPVVGVSFYEAQAYCTWLSMKTEKKYRLPTQNEWEIAAKVRGRRYVFPGHVSADKCNTIEAKLQMILPVGLLRENKTADGIYDMNGNVFEWTSTIYRNNVDPLKIQYCVKGGSWVQGAERATSSYVGRAKSWCRNLDVGLRICLDEN
jgi:formylglycine-generating enzyme required for sulfatase activity